MLKMAARHDSQTNADQGLDDSQYRVALFSDYDNLIKGDRSAIQSLVDFNMTLVDKINSQATDIEHLSKQLMPALDRLANSESEVSYLKHEIYLLRHKIASNEDATKSLFLRIEGLHELNNENLVTRVTTTLSGTGIHCVSNDIDYVRRIGQFRVGFTRPILVRFIKEGVRNSILYNRNNINLNRTSNFIWINDEVSDFTRRLRKTTRDIAIVAKQSGCDGVKVHGDGIIIGDTKFRHNDLDLLPPNVSVSKAKTRIDDENIYFQGEHSQLSNFYTARFTDESGIIYNSVEQAYQSKKARFHNKILIANKILCERDPYEIKRLSKEIPSSKDWIDQEQGIMKDLVSQKFHQNSELADFLQNTGDKNLHEASADSKWAIGAELASKACITTNWSGQDLLGAILEEVRAELNTRNPLPDDPPLGDATVTPSPDENSSQVNDHEFDQVLANVNVDSQSQTQSLPPQLDQSQQVLPLPALGSPGNVTFTPTPTPTPMTTAQSPTATSSTQTHDDTSASSLAANQQALTRSRARQSAGAANISSTTKESSPPPRPPPPKPNRATKSSRALQALKGLRSSKTPKT